MSSIYANGFDSTGISDSGYTSSNPFSGLGGGVLVEGTPGNLQTLDEGVPSTTYMNPPLSTSQGTLGVTSGAALNTVTANPTLYNTPQEGAIQDISSITGAASQWGSTIAGLISGPAAAPTPTILHATTSVSTMSSTTKLLLLAAGLLVLYLVLTEME
jgi:hypothetical protein